MELKYSVNILVSQTKTKPKFSMLCLLYQNYQHFFSNTLNGYLKLSEKLKNCNKRLVKATLFSIHKCKIFLCSVIEESFGLLKSLMPFLSFLTICFTMLALFSQKVLITLRYRTKHAQYVFVFVFFF